MKRKRYCTIQFFKSPFGQPIDPSKGEIVQSRLIELLVLIQMCFYTWKWGFYIPTLSSVQFPIGIANYIDISFLFHDSHALINATLISVLCIIGFFKCSKYSYLSAVILMHLQYVARFSQGKVGHGSMLPGLIFLVIALTPLFFTREEFRIKATTGLIIFFTGLTYESAALSKLFASGINWPNGSHLWMWIIEKSVDQLSEHGMTSFTGLQHLVLKSWPMATFFLSTGLIIECLGFCLWVPKLRPYIATALIGMHVGIFFLMNIDFTSYIWVLVLVCYPWSKLLDQIVYKLKIKLNFDWILKSDQ